MSCTLRLIYCDFSGLENCFAGVKNKTTGQAQSAWPKGYLEVEVTRCVQRKKNW